jgi:nucleoside-diphosphate-sugar epimerase
MVFVTGATGFLGSYLTRYLVKKGEHVRALRRSGSSFELLGHTANSIEWVEGNMLDIPSLESALEGIDTVYHCAAIIDTATSDKSNAIATNAEGTANLFNVALDKKVRKVVHVSSTIALGPPVDGKVIDENYYVPAEKLMSDYYRSKRQGELEAWRAQAEGLDVVIVNPSGILGAGKWSHEPIKIFPTVDKGLSFYTDGANGFVDVRDVCEIMIQLMESDITGERFIVSAENVPLRELLFMIADELSARRPMRRVTATLSNIAWRYEKLRSLFLNKPPDFTKQDMHVAREVFTYSNTKVIQATGHRFRSITSSVHETAMAYLASKKAQTNYTVFDI